MVVHAMPPSRRRARSNTRVVPHASRAGCTGGPDRVRPVARRLESFPIKIVLLEDGGVGGRAVRERRLRVQTLEALARAGGGRHVVPSTPLVPRPSRG